MNNLSAQELPYSEIPTAPESYNACNIMARLIDGLGYRYYWATEELRKADLNYTPGNDGRPAKEVLDHLMGLSNVIVNAVKQQPNIRPTPESDKSWEEIRATTLNNLKTASDILRASTDEDMDSFKVTFQRGERSSSFDYWYMINGPIADALTHVGQIVSYRRSAGNPQSPKVDVFSGKNKE